MRTIPALLAGAALTAALSLSGSHASAADKDGTTGPDVLKGTAEDDTIRGFGGHDSLQGLAANDLLYGGAGGDLLDGSTGEDVMFGGAGPDRMLGKGGKDIAYGGDGDDKFDGGLQRDLVFGESGDDTIVIARAGSPDQGTDYVSCGDGDDIVYVEPDHDDTVEPDCESLIVVE